MCNTFSILFFLQRNKVTKDGKITIYLRITMNGKRSQISIKRKVVIEKRFFEVGKVQSYSNEACSINKHLNILKTKIIDI